MKKKDINNICILCNKIEKDDWSGFCRSCKELSIWEQLKFFINKFDNGTIISRQDILDVMGVCSTNSIGSYIYGLRKLSILETIKPGKYLKHKNIPKTLTTSLMRELSSSWKGWFIPIEYLDQKGD